MVHAFIATLVGTLTLIGIILLFVIAMMGLWSLGRAIARVFGWTNVSEDPILSVVLFFLGVAPFILLWIGYCLGTFLLG